MFRSHRPASLSERLTAWRTRIRFARVRLLRLLGIAALALGCRRDASVTLKIETRLGPSEDGPCRDWGIRDYEGQPPRPYEVIVCRRDQQMGATYGVVFCRCLIDPEILEHARAFE
jgi:hypothetical protein